LADSRDLWLQIWNIERSQVAACNIGALSHRIGEQPTAVRWLSLCKEIMHPPRTPIERTLYESRLYDLARARGLVGELRVLAPAGASITLDGAPVEVVSGKLIPVNPGRHVVRAELNGVIMKAEVDVPRGETRDVKLDVPPTPPKTLAPSKDRRIARPALPPPPSGPSIGVVVGGIGGSTALLALGGGLFVFAYMQEDEGYVIADHAAGNRCYKTEAPSCREAESYWDTTSAARAAGATSLILGGVLATVTLTYALLSGRQAEVKATAGGIEVSGVW
jgi:hypothetical protein